MKCALLATVGAVLLTAQAQTPKGLQVLSATLDIPAGQVTVQLHNASDKTIVAYALQTQGFDAQGNKIGESRQVFDYAGPEPNPGKVYFIPSGRNATADYTKPEPPDPRLVKSFPDVTFRDFSEWKALASVQVSVLEVVYEDRTCEGNTGWIFDGRLRKLVIARQVLKSTLKDYPATQKERREAMDTLRLLSFNPPEEPRTEQHWETIRAEVQRNAEWWEIQSQPQGATK